MDREESNRQAAQKLASASPRLIDIRPAIDVVPGMTATTVLTAGLPLRWEEYGALQRRRIAEAAIEEGLAAGIDEVDRRVAAGEITVASSHQHGCIGPGVAVCTASLPVFVVEDGDSPRRAFCAVTGPDLRLDAGAADRRELTEVVVPVMREAIERAGGVPLEPVFDGAVRLGDELHMRAGAAGTLFTTNLFPSLLDVAKRREAEVRTTLAYMERNGARWFLRLALAGARAIAEAAHGVAGSSLVTAVIQNGRECAIRVSGLGDEWFRAPLPASDENPVGDCVLADSAALADPVPRPETVRDPGDLVYWGMKAGIDVFKVLGTDVLPTLTGHSWIAGGALVGALSARVPLDCFEAASHAYRREYFRRAPRS